MAEQNGEDISGGTDLPIGPCVTTGELIERLLLLPPDTPVLVDGYERGFSRIAATPLWEVQALDRHGEQDYLGAFERRDEAIRQAARPATALELKLGRITPPVLLGKPVLAVVLRREGFA